MYPIYQADRMEHVHSNILRSLYREAMAIQKRGIEVLKLNTGNPASFGFPLPEAEQLQAAMLRMCKFPDGYRQK